MFVSIENGIIIGNILYKKFRGEYALGDSHVLACNLGLSDNKPF